MAKVHMAEPNDPNATPGDTLDRVLAVALAQFGESDPRKISWSSWPEAFSSTSGPRGGVGGMTITTFQVWAFEHEDGRRMRWCAGVWKGWDGVVGAPWVQPLNVKGR